MASPLLAPSDYYTNLSREGLAALADTYHWFHAIDCGDFQTSGRFKPGTPQNRTLYGVFDLLQALDLRGQTCLDIGAADGLLSLGMKTLGASRVVAADINYLGSLDLVRAALGLDIEYHPDLSIETLPTAFDPATFDCIACAGVLYHLLDPMRAFTNCRRLIKEGGYLILETAFASHNNDPVMVFNPAAEINAEMNTYWLPTRVTLEAMLRMAGFELIATRRIRQIPRIAVVGRAVAPSAIAGRTPLLQKMHDVDLCDPVFRFKDLFSSPRAVSDIRMAPVESFEKIDPVEWKGTFPHHPATSPNPKGSTCWSTAEGNH